MHIPPQLYFLLLVAYQISSNPPRSPTVPTHGTKIFEHHPVTVQMVVDWFVKTISITQ